MPVHFCVVFAACCSCLCLSLLWAAGVGPSNRFAKLMSINSVILKVAWWCVRDVQESTCLVVSWIF